MQIDQRALARMLAQNDTELRQMIAAMAAGAGLDPRKLNISDADLANLRRTLTASSPADLAKLAAEMQAGGQTHGQ